MDDVTAVPELTDDEKKLGYRLERWHQYNNYKCIRCAFSTVFKPKMDEHISYGKHPYAEPGGPLLKEDPKVEVVGAPIDAAY